MYGLGAANFLPECTHDMVWYTKVKTTKKKNLNVVFVFARNCHLQKYQNTSGLYEKMPCTPPCEKKYLFFFLCSRPRRCYNGRGDRALTQAAGSRATNVRGSGSGKQPGSTSSYSAHRPLLARAFPQVHTAPDCDHGGAIPSQIKLEYGILCNGTTILSRTQ